MDKIKDILEKQFGEGNVDVKMVSFVTPSFIEINIKIPIPEKMEIVKDNILTKEYADFLKRKRKLVRKIIANNELDFFEDLPVKPEIYINIIPIKKGGIK